MKIPFHVNKTISCSHGNLPGNQDAVVYACVHDIFIVFPLKGGRKILVAKKMKEKLLDFISVYNIIDCIILLKIGSDLITTVSGYWHTATVNCLVQ